MTPHVSQSRMVSDSEEDTDEHHQLSGNHRQRPPRLTTGNLLTRHLRETYSQLTQVGQHGNVLPALGQQCLIIKGKVGVDEGQMGIIVDQTAAMVEVSFIKDNTGQRVSKLKRPSSLILLETGLTVVQEKNGTVWVQSINMPLNVHAYCAEN